MKPDKGYSKGKVYPFDGGSNCLSPSHTLPLLTGSTN